jgi:hypothetical protein
LGITPNVQAKQNKNLGDIKLKRKKPQKNKTSAQQIK